MERALTHSLASCSSLVRAPVACSSNTARQVVRAPRLALRVQAVQSLSRGTASTSASSLLNAPSAEEVAAPVSTVHSPEEFKDVVAANPGKMIVLMCKATHCRPCKLFAKKYATAAMQYKDAVFLQIMGDETKDTRAMMIEWKVRVTPTFVLFRNGEKVHSHGGINETNLHRYIGKHLQEGEAGFGTFVEPAPGSESSE